jgi:hypothetical protein
MSAFVVIVDTPYYAVTSAKGRFEIPSLPPGKYTLRAWHESGAMSERPITVEASMPPLTVLLEKR